MVVEIQNNQMEIINLFRKNDGSWVTNIDLYNTLKRLEADKCNYLYIHSSLKFGFPNPVLKKKELLEAILVVIKSLGVKNVLMPTFTFSFCNNKHYDPANSASRMGVLNEFFRKQEGVIRSSDPLMSTALLGEDIDLVLNIGHSSCGANSTFDKLRHRNNVKFLFLGPKIGDCMTYMHYLEWLYDIDFRYERRFVGEIIINDISRFEEYDLFCRYNGTTPNAETYTYEQQMYDDGDALIEPFGDGTISIVEEKKAAIAYKRFLDKDPHFFVDFAGGVFVKDKTYNPEDEVVAL